MNPDNNDMKPTKNKKQDDKASCPTTADTAYSDALPDNTSDTGTSDSPMENAADTDTRTNTPENQQNATNSATKTEINPADLQKLTTTEQLWYFIDDVIPTANHPTEVVIYDMGVDSTGITAIELFPKSMEIFDEIVNAPSHAASKYPTMVPYFPIIQQLDASYVKQNVNPYWSATPIGIPRPILLTAHMAAANGVRLFLHQEPAPGRLPFRLCYGDDSHQHDFVGIVYLSGH